MWKVLIADDEPKIRRGLSSSIERLRPDMTVVAEAEDGKAALAKTKSEKPDILMIDIRMPFLNGLELIEKIKEIHSDCIIIVVTGHDEFEYAKRALQLKVFEYVLKPVSQDILASVLERAESELAVSRSRNQYLEWARDQLERNMPLLREQFFRDWVHGRLSGYEIEEQSRFLGITKCEQYSMALIHVVERPVLIEPSKEKERKLALLAVRKIVEEEFQPFKPLSIFQDENENIVVFGACTRGTDWVETISLIEDRVSRYLSELLVVSQKQAAGGAEDVPEAYELLISEIASKSSRDKFVVLTQNFLDAHFADPDLTLEKTASAVGISPGYLSRMLKQETGLSFIDFLTRVRISRAIQLLNDPAIKIYEVAEAVGYQSQHYFSRTFKRVLGRCPVDYRKKGE